MPYAPDTSRVAIPTNVVTSSINPDALKLKNIEEDYSRQSVGLPAKPVAQALENVPTAMDALNALDEKKKLAVNYKIMDNILAAGMPAVKDMWVEIGSPPELDPAQLEATLGVIKDPAKQKEMVANWYAAATGVKASKGVAAALQPGGTGMRGALEAAAPVLGPKDLLDQGGKLLETERKTQSAADRTAAAKESAKKRDETIRRGQDLILQGKKIVASTAAGKKSDLQPFIDRTNTQIADVDSQIEAANLELDAKRAEDVSLMTPSEINAHTGEITQILTQLRDLGSQKKTHESNLVSLAKGSAAPVLTPPPKDTTTAGGNPLGIRPPKPK